MVTTTTGIATEFIQFTRASNATVTDSDGKVKWAPHNLLLASEQFDSASWTKTIAAITANNIEAPDGRITADKLLEQSGTSFHGLYQSGGSITAFQVTFAVFVKGGLGRDWVRISYDGGGAKTAWFNIASGTVGTVNAGLTASTPQLVGNGFYLIQISFTGAASGNVAIGPATSDGVDSYAGDITKGLYLWGAHLYRSDLGGMQANTSAYPMYNPTTPKNLLRYTEDFSNAVWVKNSTTVTTNTEISPNGLQTADTLTALAGTGVIPRVADTASATTITNTVYTASIYARPGTYQFLQIYINSQGTEWANYTLSGSGSASANGSATANITSVGNGWYRLSITYTAGGTDRLPLFMLAASASATRAQSWNPVGTETIHLWGAQLSDSASLDPYVPVYGAAVTSAAYYGPRRDFDPVTLACKGLLVEEQRTNLLLYSADFTLWAAASTTITANQVVAPDGTLTADTFAASTTGTFRYVYQAPTLTQNVTYTFSAYFKTKTARWVWLLGETSNDALASFDIQNGVVGAVAAGLTSSITPVGNGWYRCVITFTVTSATGVQQIGFGLSDSNTVSNPSATAGIDAYVWGSQLEANASFPTSYIPVGTTTAGATRNADVAQVSTAAFPYSATEGTVVVNVQHMASPSSQNQTHWQIIGASNILSTDRFATSTSVAVRGLGLNADTSKTLTTNVAKVGTSFTTTEVNLLINGGSAYTNTSASGTLSGAVLFNIGNVTGAASLNGWMRQVTYLPRKLSVSELQTRTQ